MFSHEKLKCSEKSCWINSETLADSLDGTFIFFSLHNIRIFCSKKCRDVQAHIKWTHGRQNLEIICVLSCDKSGGVGEGQWVYSPLPLFLYVDILVGCGILSSQTCFNCILRSWTNSSFIWAITFLSVPSSYISLSFSRLVSIVIAKVQNRLLLSSHILCKLNANIYCSTCFACCQFIFPVNVQTK